MRRWVYLQGGGMKRNVYGEWICRVCGNSYAYQEQSFKCKKCGLKMCELCFSDHHQDPAFCEVQA